MKTYIFPGQGSQTLGMGESLFDEYTDLVKKADKILGYSIKELCLKDPRRELHNTQFTQPALYIVNALSYYKKIEDSGSIPDYVAGHSLGEFNALLAAECFDFEAGLKLVKKRGELMSQVTDGAMAAILNASKEEIEKILKENKLNNIDIANYNSFSQIVISGSKDEIGKAESLFQQGKMMYIALNTSGAFHSRFMQPIRDKFSIYFKKFKLSNPKIPVISNVTAKPYNNDNIIENLSNQISSSVRWSDCILYLLKQGAEKGLDMEIEEVGHGDTLSKIVVKIKKETDNIIQEIKANINNNDTLESINSSSQANVEIDIKNVENNDQAESLEPTTNISIEQKVNAWNKKYPVGTKVESTVMEYNDLETRTEAVVLFGHRAAVYMKGYNGYFDLDEVRAL